MSEQPPGKHNTDRSANADLRQALHEITRAKTRLVVCFWTLPVYVAAIWILLNNGRGIASMMWIYMVVYAGFAIDMAMRRCPVCHNQFYVKRIFLNLLTKNCVHCGRSSCAAEFSSKD